MNTTSAISLHARPRRRPEALLSVALGLVIGLAALPALAQGIYRIVGPDGRVTYSDQPPPAQVDARPVGSATTSTAASANAQLPFALRQVINRYPVTLYTSNDCAPCNSGRIWLNNRGIPYAEKTINTAQDSEALKRLSGEMSLPFLTIGAQQIKGYSDAEWTQFMDAAGYPKQSALPASYRRPAPSPLVAVKAAEPAPNEPAAPAGNRRNTPNREVPVPTPTESPTGIRF